MSEGTIRCGNIVTAIISNPDSGNIQIGNFTWPISVPSSGTVLKTSGDGTLSFEQSNVRTEVDPLQNTYNINNSDDIVAITGTLATTLNLPDPSTKTVGDFIYIVKEVSGTSIVTIQPFASELISGNTTVTISDSYASAKIYTNSTNWFILI